MLAATRVTAAAAARRFSAAIAAASLATPKAVAANLAKPVKVSADLAPVLGVETTTRGEALKLLWVYIKAHNLQVPDAKTVIRPDAALAKAFGSPQAVAMTQLMKLLAPHLTPMPEPAPQAPKME